MGYIEVSKFWDGVWVPGFKASNHSSEKKNNNNKIIIIIIVNFWAGLHNKNSPSFLKNKLALSYALCECNEAFYFL